MIRVGGLLLLLLAVPMSARADGPLSDRNYAIDAFRGAAIADYRVVGMGGVSLATATGASGLLANPAAPASRPSAGSGWFDWDFLLDAYTPGLGVDFENNGTTRDRPNGKPGAVNAGLVGMFGAWGAALSVTTELRELGSPDGTAAALSASLSRVTLARAFADGDFVAGASLVTGAFNLALPARGVELVNAGASTVEAGALWRPRERNVRLGLSFRPAMKPRLDPSACDPLNCAGYVIPDRVAFPWSAGAGVAWRFGTAPWNRRVAADFIDERSTVLAADLIADGPVKGGTGLEAFLDNRLQRSGQRTTVSMRLGAEHEWVPGWFRIRSGLYWEPPRYENVSGRLHLTLGLDVRVWSFSLWGSNYRVRVSFAGDGAQRYGNSLVSLGFWH